jgi:hypothetical protein
MAASTTSSLIWGWNSALDNSSLYGEGLGQMSQQSILLTAIRCWQRILSFGRDREPALQGAQNRTEYSVAAGSQDALASLCDACRGLLPGAILNFTQAVEINSTSEKGDAVHIPTPLREQEAVTAIKALEACAAAAITTLRYGTEIRPPPFSCRPT